MNRQAPTPGHSPGPAFQRAEQIATFGIFAALALYQFGNSYARYLFMIFTLVGGLALVHAALRDRRLDFSWREYTFAAITGWLWISALCSWLLHPSDIALLRVKQFALWSAWGGGALLVLHYFIPRGFSQRLFCLGLITSAIVTGLASIYLFYYIDDDARVAMGQNFPTIFGGIAALNGILCLYFALREKASKPLQAALFIGLVGTLLTAYASGARGAWLGLSVMLPYVVLTTPTLQRRYKLAIIAVIGAGFITTTLYSDAVSSRMAEIEADLHQYFVEGDAFSSIGLRLDSWKACLVTFSEHPLVGVGDDLLGVSFAPLIAAGEIHPYMKPFDHVHNDFLQFAHAKGLLGVVAYLGLLALPILLAAPRWRSLAVIVSLSYFIFGMTDVFFKIESSVVYYFLISVLLINMRPAPGQG